MNNINQDNNNIASIVNCRFSDTVNLLRAKEEGFNFSLEMD